MDEREVTGREEMTGAVMVVGGGIAGIQSSLDLAESGYKVYLVEKDAAIGGRMARLDKTFPTNDCSMCILSPKLVDCGRHLNIDIITGAEVENIEGEAGNFEVTLHQDARYVDVEECTGCGDCAEVCPVNLSDEFNEGFADKKAIYKLYPQAIPNAYSIDKKGRPPCREGCPAGCNVQGYTALVSQGEFEAALDVIRRDIPFPGICGRVCHHPCEDMCNREQFDDPVSVAALKRAAADHGRSDDVLEKLDLPELNESRVAVIGAGPAGLSAAYFLRQEGIAADVFEKREKPGGMLRYGIPDYRLPGDILEAELEKFYEIDGIEINCGQELGEDISLAELKEEYDAVIVAVGCWQPASMRTEGEELALGGIDFLEELADRDYEMEDPGETIVVGGGNTAMDCVRSALRLTDEEVHCYYRRTEEQMPAEQIEIDRAREEGCNFEFLSQPISLREKDDGRLVLECIKMELGEPDETGRRRPIPIEGSEFEVEADTVIAGIGQNTIPPGDLPRNEWGDVEVAGDSYLVEDNVFAAGDCVTGPATVVEAIAGGRGAAESIKLFFQGEDPSAVREEDESDDIGPPEMAVQTERRIGLEARRPEERINDFNEVSRGYTIEQAVEEAERCLDCALCSECLECVKSCEPDCIDHDSEARELKYEVGSVLFNPGSDAFADGDRNELGYEEYDNVITSMEYERMLSASGPFQGEILKPSDGNHPDRIAFIQCVGSRDHSCDRNYCSSVCCMYTIKQAFITREHRAEMEIDIFYMDIRAFSKGFERYFNRLENMEGVNFIRSRVAEIEEGENPGSLKLKSTDGDDGFHQNEYDMVVLASGLEPSQQVKEQLQKLQIRTDGYGFAAGDEFAPLTTGREGIYTCGAVNGPMDIPETVTEASGAAARASELLAPARNTMTEEKEYPPEKELDDELKIGVFICHCGINIGGVIDVPAVVDDAAELDDVVLARDNLYSCSQDSLDKIKEHIDEYDLNRVVVASCTPRTHEPLYQDTIREAGLNPHLFEMTNIREQASWVHPHKPESATDKARDLVEMAVNRVRRKQPLYTKSFDITERAVVAGGGLAGMVSALSLAEQGYPVSLVEKQWELGGHADRLKHSLEDRPLKPHLESIKSSVREHELIDIHLGYELQDISGFVGNFQVGLDSTLPSSNSSAKAADIGEDEPVKEIEGGVIVVATGGREYTPDEYGYNFSDNVITQLELEERLEQGMPRAESIYMVQCVGSREEKRPYCSRLCCSQALRNAIHIKERSPETDITILYREMRSYGFYEDLYRRARELGVNFSRYSEEEKPDVGPGEDGLRIRHREPLTGSELEAEADLVVLSPAILPGEDNQKMSQMLKTPLNEDDFFLEAHVKLRPVDSSTEGIFICGLAHSPKNVRETIAQARAASMRAATVLSQGELESTGTVATVKERLCTACGLCVEICPYDAKEIDEERKVAAVNEVLCQGCGACSAGCPSGASRHLGFQKQEIMAMIEASL